MKSFAITFVLCFFGFVTMAADTTIVTLIRKIIDIEIDTSYRYFYLYDKAQNPSVDEYTFNDIHKYVPDLPINEVRNIINSDTTTFNWDTYNLPKAKLINIRNKPEMPLLVEAVKSISDADSLSAMSNKKSNYHRILEKINRFSFSKPVFSPDKKFALITSTLYSGGAWYVFKNTNGIWHLVYRNRWTM